MNLAREFLEVAVLACGLSTGVPLGVSGNLVEQKAEARPSVQMHQMWHIGSQRALSAHCWWDHGPKPNHAVDTWPLSEEEKNIPCNDILALVPESWLLTIFSVIKE